jgi:hypothetical protein
MNFLSPYVLYFNILKWGQSICMYHTRDDICLIFFFENKVCQQFKEYSETNFLPIFNTPLPIGEKFMGILIFTGTNLERISHFKF